MLSILEGLLFMAGDEGIVLNDATEIFENITIIKLEELIGELSAKYYNDITSGLTISKFAGNRYRMSTKKENYEWYLKLVDVKTEAKLSNAAIEVLAIIAYKQPISRPEIEEIRGVNCDSIIYKLKFRELIEEAGKSELPGKPINYKVTDKFMKLFEINSLNELPQIDFENNDTIRTLFS